ncbi:MAG: PAS domain S-box protein, partial [Candidatus Cloacimonetes bacterium]|nr:PAS domain S-box protein [Candidatus Cloacimonadota bacterium]
MDRDFNFIEVNQAYADAGRKEREYFIGKNHFDIYPHAENEVIFKKAVEKGETQIRTAKPFNHPNQPERGITYWDWSLIPIKDESGSVQSLVLSVLDVTYRMQAEIALRESEERYRAIFENTGTATVIIEEDSIISLANSEFTKLSGYSLDRIEGKKSWREFVVQDDLERMKKQHELRRANGNAALKTYEFRFIDRNSDVKDIFLSIDMIKGTKKSIASLLDISERKKAEERIKFLSSFVEQSADGMAIADLKGNLLFINDTWASMHGYEKVEELLGQHLSIFHNEEQFKNYVETFNSIVMETGYNAGEVGHIRKDGTIFPTEMTTTLLKDGNGIPVAMAGMATDITERRKAEEALFESEMRYRTLFETAGDAIFLMKGDMFIECNQKTTELFECTREDILSHSPVDFSPPIQPDGRKSNEKALEKINAAVDGNPQLFEWQHKTLNGSLFDAEVRLNKVEMSTGIHIQAIVRNITERKTAEAALKQSEEKYRTLIDKNQDGVFIEQNGKIIFINEAFTGMIGFNADELVGRDFIQLIAPVDRELVADRYRLRQAGEDVPTEYEIHILHKDGVTQVIVILNVGIIQYQSAVASMGTVKDITERKKAELIQKVLYDISNASNSTQDIDELYLSIRWHLGKIVDATNMFIALYNQETSSFSLPFYIDEHDSFTIHPAGKSLSAYVIKQNKSLLLTKEDIKRMTEEGIVQSIGSKCESWLGVPLRFGKNVLGNITLQSYRKDKIYTQQDLEILEFVSDQIAMAIQRKQSEEALRASEEKFREMAELLPELIYECDVHGNLKYVNRIAFEKFGYMQEDFDKGVNALQFLVPEDRKIASLNIEKTLLGYEKVPVEYKAIRKDGSEFPIIVHSSPIISNGKPVGLRGIIVDITEIKQIEEQLRERVKELKVLFGLSKIAERENITLEELYLETVNIIPSGMQYPENTCLRITIDDMEFLSENYIDSRWKITANIMVKDAIAGEIEIANLVEKPKRNGSSFLKEEQALIDVVAETLGRFTEKKRAEVEITELEAQFRQAQKMEAIGILAGGVAHDFNNILNVILGYSELLMMDFEKEDPNYIKIDNIMKSASRAINLTRQLLAFSRKQILQPTILCLNNIVKDIENMLYRLIGEDIEFTSILAENLYTIKADSGQIEQVIMNLVVNARDAMPEGGKLVIETQNVELDEEYASKHKEAAPGKHVMLAISDTGIGMTKEVQERIFEPFFTTKEHGKGTGLGISTAYGIVKQSGGSIWVYSEPDKGTTFKIYFPAKMTSTKQKQIRIT